MKKNTPYFLVFCLLIVLNGCSLVYKGTGKVMISYAEDQGVPYMLAADDIALTCSMTESFSPFLLSFSQVTTPPDQLAILFYLMAGNCTEFKAQNENLRYLRAVYAKNVTEAQDARIAQQRLLGLAAQRQFKGYQYLLKAFIEPGLKCPDFSNDREQLYWLLGLANGIQALLNDVASEGAAGVPLDIAAKVSRGASCLDNKKWWGVPKAIQAAIWMTTPGNIPADKNPQQILQQSMQIGLQQGIKMSYLLAAQAYLGQGDIKQVKSIIRDYTKFKQTAMSQRFKSLNQVSHLQIQAISDRLWTEATGKRTPTGKIGSFWDDPKKQVDTVDIDEFL